MSLANHRRPARPGTTHVSAGVVYYPESSLEHLPLPTCRAKHNDFPRFDQCEGGANDEGKQCDHRTQTDEQSFHKTPAAWDWHPFRPHL